MEILLVLWSDFFKIKKNSHGFDVANFWECFVRRTHERCHGEDLFLIFN